jgi:hypothetical protein
MLRFLPDPDNTSLMIIKKVIGKETSDSHCYVQSAEEQREGKSQEWERASPSNKIQ